MSEIWKDLDFIGFPNYQVSNCGRVKGPKGLRKLKLNKQGYPVTILYNKYDRKDVAVHRLVAMAFIDNTENKPCVDHIDTNKLNNCVDNLRWVTFKENANNPLTLKHLSASLMGDKNGMFGKHHTQESLNKISQRSKGGNNPSAHRVYQYDLNLNLIKEYDCCADAARDNGIKWGVTISAYARGDKGVNKPYKGFIWSYNKLNIN